MISGCCPIVLIASGYNSLEVKTNNICGIYGISGLVLSSFETAIYVGSATNMKNRLVNQHIRDLNSGIHKNPPLQNYFNVNGIENLVFFHLESCSKEDLLKTEQKYIDYYGVAQDKKAFNVCPIAGNSLGVKKSEATKEKIRLIRTGTECSEASKIKRSISLKGMKRSEESCNNIKNGKSKDFNLISPEGIVHIGKNLKEFSKKHQLSYTKMYLVRSGQRKSHKGWTNANPPKKPIKTNIEYEFISPEGKIHKGRGVTNFIKEVGFGRKHFPKLHRNEIEEFRGWKNNKKHTDVLIDEPVYKYYHQFLSPEGKIIMSEKYSFMEKSFGLRSSNLCQMKNGKRNHVGGWKFFALEKIKETEIKKIDCFILNEDGSLTDINLNA